MYARRLLTLVTLLSFWPVVSSAQSGTQSKPATAPATKSVTAAPAAKGEPLDLNTATPDQLKALPGIGDAYAKRIVDGRPYTMKNQLTQRGILPQATYDKIKDSVVAKRPAGAAKAAASAPAAKK